MAKALERPPAAVDYERDFYGWALAQAAHLRAGQLAALDLANLAEEVEGLARSERRELRHRYATLLLHLLKWRYQPTARSRGWMVTIRRERRQIDRHVRENPSLRPLRATLFAEAYPDARDGALLETRMGEDAFPATCPFTLDEVMDEGFWPGEPWAGR